VQVAEEVSREGEVTRSNPTDRVAANFALASGPPPPIEKNFSRFFSHFFISRFAERRAL
jgi:hypothetical protein